MPGRAGESRGSERDDRVFASDRAAFEWAYSKTSLTGAESATFLLPRLIGLRRTMGMVFLNPRLTPQEALAWGLINGIFPFETFDQEVEAVAQRLSRGPTRAWAITKALINEALGIDRLDSHMAKEVRHSRGDRRDAGLRGGPVGVLREAGTPVPRRVRPCARRA